MYGPVNQFVNYLSVYFGVLFIALFPVLVLISQVSLAVRECALNSRKEDFSFSATDYKSLEWVAYFLFYVSWLFLVVGLIFIIAGLTHERVSLG